MEIKKLIYNDGSWSENFPKDMDSPKTIVLIFGNDEQRVQEVIKAFPKSHIAGSSTFGEIYGGHVYDKTVSVSVIKFSDVKIKSVEVPFTDYAESYNTGVKVFQELNEDKLSGILVFTKGLVFNGDQFAKGINSKNNKNVLIGGGMAGDPEVKDTWVISKQGKRTQAVVAVGFYGDNFQMMISTESGITPLGVERTVTKSDKNILYEVNHKPALEFYREFLGDNFKDLTKSAIQYPIAVSKDYKISQAELVRTPYTINEKDQSVTFTGEVPEGLQIRLMMAGSENMVSGSEKAAQDTKTRIKKAKGDPAFVLLVSCASRKMVMGEFTEEEIDMVQTVLGQKDYTISGYYAFGEIVSAQGGTCVLQNQTINLISFYEKKAA